MRRTISLFTLMILIGGCATAQKMNNVSLGMNKAEVIKAMGRPSSTKAIGNEETLEYMLSATSNDDFNGIYNQYWITLQDGRVVSYGRAGDYDTAIPKDK